jgi:tryptophan synthase alpha chain
MNRIQEAFKELKRKNRKALIVYITAGYPNLRKTAEIAVEIAKSGADMIELGIPFSDPLADGPTIQESSHEALIKKTGFQGVFKAVEEIRKKTSVPLIFMSYYNPVYSYGVKKLVVQMKKTGVDGIIVPDLPVEECGGLKAACDDKEIALILLAASNTPPERLKLIARETTGFIYCLSHIGITGSGSGIQSGLREFIGRLRKITRKPLAVGFGISKREDVRLINSFADGAIVGSAVIEVIKKNSRGKNLPGKTAAFVRCLKTR